MNKGKTLKLLAIIFFVAMVAINILANTIPINGNTTAEVSDSFPNLFAPAGGTFSIWGLIYLVLAAYSFYQLRNADDDIVFFKTINYYFIISSMANILWIISWHYKLIVLSMVFILVLFYSLTKINNFVNTGLISKKKRIFARLPFNIYYGWISVATVANAVTVLSSLGVNMINIPLTILALLIGLVIIISVLSRYQNPAYGLTAIWGYGGILIKHISKKGFNMNYKSIIAVVAISILVIAYKTFIDKTNKGGVGIA